jgi:hypothetical protein
MDKAVVLKQLDEVLEFAQEVRAKSQFDDLSDTKDGASALITLLAQSIDRFSDSGSAFKRQADKIISEFKMENCHRIHRPLLGVVMALRKAYESGYLQSLQELIHADVFADFLEMADHLLSEGYKDPAAVMAGGVLEEHIRKLCLKSGIAVSNATGTAKKASLMNDELLKASVYDKLEQKSVNAWLDLRNKAAHGKYDEYSIDQVSLLIQGIRGFMLRNRA